MFRSSCHLLALFSVVPVFSVCLAFLIITFLSFHVAIFFPLSFYFLLVVVIPFPQFFPSVLNFKVKSFSPCTILKGLLHPFCFISLLLLIRSQSFLYLCISSGSSILMTCVSSGFMATARQIYGSIYLQRNQNLTSRSINPCSEGKMSL